MTTSGEPNLRLFIAIELPPSWLEALAALQERLRRSLAEAAAGQAPRLRWTRPEGIHLTLKFLGATPVSKRAAVEAAIATVVHASPNLGLELGEVGTFPDRRPARVLWVGLRGDLEPLAALAGAIDAAVAPLGYDRENRPFAPHLTLARVPENVPSSARAAIPGAMAAATVEGATPFVAERVSLIQSHLRPTGARYERLASFPRL